MIKELLAGCAMTLALATVAEAQVGPPITQTATRSDAATFIYDTADGSTTCNSGGVSSSNATLTITPPAGQYVYLTELVIDTYNATTTGSTQTATISATNLTGAPIFPDQTAAGFLGINHLVYPFNPPLKSTAAGTAVTFVPSAAQSTSSVTCMVGVGYFAQ